MKQGLTGRGSQQSSNSFLPWPRGVTELPSRLLVNFQDNGFVLFEKKKSMTLMTIKGHRVYRLFGNPELIFSSSCVIGEGHNSVDTLLRFMLIPDYKNIHFEVWNKPMQNPWRWDAVLLSTYINKTQNLPSFHIYSAKSRRYSESKPNHRSSCPSTPAVKIQL